MRYVLLFSDGSIHIGAQDEEGKYCVWAQKGWRAGIDSLARLVKRRAAREGKITNLEIQSHGDYGRIVVPPDDDITNDNVHMFAGTLRPLMAKGGLIEIMACKVAGFGRFSLQPDKGVSQYPSEVCKQYFGGYLVNPVVLTKVGTRHVPTPLTQPQMEVRENLIQDALTTYLGSNENGLDFCLALARGTGAIVRASGMTQVEEYGDIYGAFGEEEKPNPIMRDYDRFGDWEGPVWDFMPNGSVKFLGTNLPRHRVRFPAHPVPTGGQQLTYNFREQGGHDSGVGQRPQRMNRNPLPV